MSHRSLSLPRALKVARVAARMSGQQVAEALGVTQQAVSKWESDSAGVSISEERLESLAKLYDTTAASLLALAGARIDRPVECSTTASGPTLDRELLRKDRQLVQQLERAAVLLRKAIALQEVGNTTGTLDDATREAMRKLRAGARSAATSALEQDRKA